MKEPVFLQQGEECVALALENGPKENGSSGFRCERGKTAAGVPPLGGISGSIPPKGGTPARSPVQFAPKTGRAKKTRHPKARMVTNGWNRTSCVQIAPCITHPLWLGILEKSSALSVARPGRWSSKRDFECAARFSGSPVARASRPWNPTRARCHENAAIRCSSVAKRYSMAQSSGADSRPRSRLGKAH